MGMWTCVSPRCKLQKPVAQFQKAMEKYGGEQKSVTGRRRRCDDCYAREGEKHMNITRKSFEHIQKKQTR